MKSLKWYLLAIGLILVSVSSHAWATNLPIGGTVDGAINQAAQVNPYTFSANAGDVFDFTLVATSGNLSPEIQVKNSAGAVIGSAFNYACSGSTIELNTLLIPANGTYTVDVSDCSDTAIGDYVLYAQRIDNPFPPVADITFGQTLTGMIGSAAQSNSYTFSADANDVVYFTMTTTSGNLSPKIRIYNPDGSPNSSAFNYACSGSTLELTTAPLPKSGTFTALAGDCGDTNAGDYEIYAQRTDDPGKPIGIPAGQTQTGTIGSAAQSNSYTFSANANDVVYFTMTNTSGNLSPKIRLYNPDGSLNSSAFNYACSGSTLELTTAKLPKSGTYTVLAGDCSDTYTGNYAIYSQRTNDPGGIVNPLPFGQTQTAMIGSAAQSSSYTFSANANDVVYFTMTTTSGNLSPKIRVYNPDGSLNSSAFNYACSGSTLELTTAKLPKSGTYTVLAGDCSDTYTGNYAIYTQRVSNPTGSTPLPPAGGVPILWGQVQSGKIASPAQSNTYYFVGTANNVVDLTMVATSGTLSPKIRVYNPDGSLLSSAYPYACSGSTIELNSVTLTQPGVYTMLVGDCSDTSTGNYNLSSQCFGTCPITPVITWPLPAAITYPTPLGPTQLDAIANEPGTFVYTPPAGTVLKAGLQTLSVVFTPTDSTLYTKAAYKVPLTVNKATPVCTWATPAAIVYPTPLSATQLDASCSVPGTYVYSPPSGTVLAVGAHTLTVTFTPTDTTDYTTATDSVDLTVITSGPTLTKISPSSAIAGGAGFTMTLTGTNFVSGATVKWNGTALVTTYVSATELQAAVPATDIATAGYFPVTVINPGGGASNPITFTVNNPVPTLASISPSSATAGGSAVTLTLAGSNFVRSSIVKWNGVGLTTTYVSTTQLKAAVPAANIATAGPFPVTVFNPLPGGGTSNSITFTVNNPLPSLTSISPSSATAGGAGFSLTVSGSNFVKSSIVKWNAVGLATTYVSATQLKAAVPSTDIATAGHFPVTVFNPTPGGGTSNLITFIVNSSTLAPTLISLSPPSGFVGGPASTLTVSGTNFVNGSIVRWNGASLVTTYVSSTQLKAAVPATDLAAPGAPPITVINPTPPTGPSNAVPFNIIYPPPALTAISPDSITAGGSAFTLTLTGSNLVKQSVVKWNGTALTTTYVSGTELQAAVPDSDSWTGTVSVTVSNPTPGGGTSGAQTFTINNPVPILASLSPSSATAGGGSFTMTVNGYNFVEGAVVRWKTTALTTTYLSGMQLQVTIPAADIATAGSASVTVVNPTPSPSASNALTFTIN